MEQQVFVVGDDERGLRLDRFLGRRIPRMSRTSVQEAIAGRVTISSGAAPKPSRQVFPGEVVVIRPRVAAPPRSRDAPAVLHESDGWIVVDKPAGLATTPSASRPGEDLASLTGMAPAHRLDRFTSGCLVLTWSAGAARHFERVFREHRARKEYVALVLGRPREDAFVVDVPLEPDPESRVPAKMRASASPLGQEARTDVMVIRRFDDVTLLRAIPATGRRHQIRVHLAHVGHPVAGDLLYGGDERDFVRFQLGQRVHAAPAGGASPGRHLLHARRLVVPDVDGRVVEVEAPLPADLAPWADGA